MKRSHLFFLSHPFLLLFHLPLLFLHQSHAQPSITGYSCSPNQTIFPCQTYVFFRASSPNLLDLASIGDLFNLSRLSISKPSNISSPSSPLSPNQSLLIPISCSCNTNISYANITHQIEAGDTFYDLSTTRFQNLTTYQAVEVVNPSLVATNLTIGVEAIFPIFCSCPNKTQVGNQTNFLITYVFQPSDSISSVARLFGTDNSSIIALNGANISPFSTVLVPVSRIPQLQQPTASPASSSCERKGVTKGAVVGLGVLGALLFVSIASIAWLWWVLLRRGKKRGEEEEKAMTMKKMVEKQRFGTVSATDFMADVSECLDKYKLYGVEELREATSDFDSKYLIHGSVYKGFMRGDAFAIKKMKWNAYEELKILQKVNHSNLVKLDGFCIDPEEGNCYLVYEYIENGSLNSWLHGNGRRRKLDWRTRLQIAVDVASGLQYIHEHTRPSVVHKDIKTSNILLDGKMRAKIANFGLAKSGCNAMTTNIVGTQGYLAPEYLADGFVTTKIDVFAFGVVLLELVSGKEAIDEAGKPLWMQLDKVFDGREDKEERLKAWMDEALLEHSCSLDGVMNVMAVAKACLQKNPGRRPSMVDIVYMLCKADELLFDFSEDGLPVPSGVMAR
ncbi:serine/threonine receptor-like protein kinase NFP [Cinnamomum micranthum f. kanehirae]|uniref:Serine/threonine receptor-like protein kinase NFP n=1 Tax=Cinnamomum micranthum f. kanehirae TaxID=337451 RepID=A0A443NQX5_9MAGN|nr:serine/threonine receptor-like protein kinase NFP [Cinnamomum micranthum f. kanehirae]